MAQTGRRQSTLAIAQTSAELAMLGANAAKDYSAEDIDNLFKTDARACKTTKDRWLYFVKCKAMGLSPFSRQLYAVERTVNKGKPNQFTTVVFMVSYHVYVSRARQAGFVPVAGVVCEKDEWGGWDAVNSRPVKHIEAIGDRGRILGAWVVMKRERDNATITGKMLPYRELVLDNESNPSWRKMPVRMAMKCAILEGCRMVAPDLASVMGAEEVGYSIEDNPRTEHAVFGPEPKAQLEAQARELDGPTIDVEATTVDGLARSDGEAEAEADTDPFITPSQSSDLIAAFTAAKKTRRSQILEYCSTISGHPVTRMGELRQSEYDAIINALYKEDTDGR